MTADHKSFCCGPEPRQTFTAERGQMCFHTQCGEIKQKYLVYVDIHLHLFMYGTSPCYRFHPKKMKWLSVSYFHTFTCFSFYCCAAEESCLTKRYATLPPRGIFGRKLINHCLTHWANKGWRSNTCSPLPQQMLPALYACALVYITLWGSNVPKML